MPVRPQSINVQIENSGLVVFVYDPANAEIIKNAKPGLLTGFAGEEDLSDRALMQLASDGQLLAYELFQDDDISLEVIVGPPLTAAEKRSARWHKAQASRLCVTSGRVRIETYDSLTLWADTPTHPGAEIDVPPGDYVAALNRIDWNEMEAEDLDGHQGPQEILTLTPRDPSKRAKAPAMLMYPVPKPVWGKYEIVDGVFMGKSAGETMVVDGLVTNLDRQAADTLGLTRGMGLELTIGGSTYPTVYLGDLCYHPMTIMLDNDWRRYYDPDALEALKTRYPTLLQATWSNAGEKDFTVLSFRQLHGRCPASADVAVGAPITVRVLQEPILPAPDNAWIDDITIENGVVRGIVIACTDHAVVLNTGSDTLERIGVTGGSRLKLALEGAERLLVYCSSAADLPAARRDYTIPPEQQKLLEELQAKMAEIRQAKRETPLVLDDGFTTNPAYAALSAAEDDVYDKLKVLKEPELTPDRAANMGLGGYMVPHWDHPNRLVLKAEPLWNGKNAVTGLNVPAGTSYTLTVEPSA